MVLDQAHLSPLNITSSILIPEYAASIQKSRLSTIDTSTIRRNWIGNVAPASYALDVEGRSLVNKQTDTHLMCSVTGKPRLSNSMLRVRFSGTSSTYNAIVALSSYGLVGRLAYRDLFPLGVWITVKVVYGTGGTYSFLVNDVLLYKGTACIDLGFYFGKGSSKVELDVGQLGTPLLAGYVWY